MALGGIFTCNDQDADVLANYGPVVGNIQYEMQQLEQRAAQAGKMAAKHEHGLVPLTSTSVQDSDVLTRNGILE